MTKKEAIREIDKMICRINEQIRIKTANGSLEDGEGFICGTQFALQSLRQRRKEIPGANQ